MRTTRWRKEDGHGMGRRNFLRMAAFLWPAAAALLAGKTRTARQTSEKPSATEGTRYRLTEHITKYYRTL